MMVVGPNFQDAHFSRLKIPCAKKIKKGGHQKLGVGRLFAINNNKHLKSRLDCLSCSTIRTVHKKG
jgi:hypothetical protein